VKDYVVTLPEGGRSWRTLSNLGRFVAGVGRDLQLDENTARELKRKGFRVTRKTQPKEVSDVND